MATMAGGGGWSAAMAIGDRMKAEAAQARKEIDEFTAKVLDSGKAGLGAVEESTKATDAETAAVKKNVRAFLDSNKEKAAGVDLYAKMIKQADDLVASIQFETKLLTMNNVEKETAIALQKLANMGIKEGTKEYEKYSEAIIAATLDKAQVQSIIDSNKKIEEARLEAIKKADEARKKMEEDAAKQLRDLSNQIGQSLSDALMNGGKSAKQYLQDLFRTLILRPIVQPLITGSISGILLGAAGTATAAGIGDATGGSVGGSLGLMSAASSLKNLYDMATGSFSSLGASASGLTRDLGQWMLSNSEITSLMTDTGAAVLDTTGQVGTALVDSAASLGSIASYLGGAGAGLGLGNLISGGLGIGGSSWNTVATGTAIGALLGPLGAAAGGILGGLANKMFGSGAKEYGAAGITGTYSATGASIQNYQEWSKPGGWFSGGSSGTDLSPADATLQATLSKTLAGISLSVANFTRQLGESAAGVSQFSQSINLNVAGLSAADAQTKIQESLTAFGDSLAAFVVPAVANYQKANESAGAALNRLATSLTTVNGVFGTLNLKLMETSLSGADAADKLTALFGGADAFVQATNYYYQNFYTEQERAAKTAEQLSAVFAQLGVVMPTTRDAFRGMVESARAAGNNALFASLLKLAPTFNDLETSLTNLQSGSAITKASLSGLDAAFTALQASFQSAQADALAAIDRQRSLAQAAKDAASESVSALKSLFDYLKGQVSGILQVADVTGAASNGLAFVSNALAAAKSTGYLPDQSALSDAVSAARSGLVSSNFSSSYDMRLAQMKLAADLQGLMEITGDQKTVADMQLEVAQSQLAALDAQAEEVKAYYAAQLSYAQAQVDQLKGVSSGVLAIADAMSAFGIAVSAAQPSAPASMSSQIDALYQSLLGRSADPSGLADWIASGLSIDGVRQGILGSQEYQTLPHFAAGGSYDGGLALVGERGPELINFDAPGTVYSANQTRGIMGSGSEVASEVRALREETAKQREDMRAASRAMVQAQMRMTKMMERWDSDGVPSTRLETA